MTRLVEIDGVKVRDAKKPVKLIVTEDDCKRANRKRPSFQFYPADWRKDAELQSCGIAARGLWHEMLCIMHECDPYGYLVVNGKPMKVGQLARLVGVPEKECASLLQELMDAGVPGVDEAGRLYSRRMVRDEQERDKWRDRQAKSRASHADVTAQPDQSHTLSSSSSSSSPSGVKEESISSAPAPKRGRLKNLLNGHLEDFEEFWRTYPKRVKRGTAEKAYLQALKLTDAATILAGAKRYAELRKDEDATYTAYASSWLNGKCWLDEFTAPDGADPEMKRLEEIEAAFRKEKGYE